MNFYEHQDRARRRTKIIVFLFIVAVLLIVCVVTVPVGLFSEWNPGAIATAVVFCVLIVGISTLVKLRQLSSGGHVVAEMLGGTAVQTSDGDPAKQRIKNIVEEMAIASGMPVPPVYVIEDDSINAFAAGWSTSDAVVGVTRGCIEQLDRDELQGVVAHEFSHISHGDMRINIRLIGVIFGIMALGITGWIFVRYIGPAVLYSSSRSRSKDGAGGAGVGLAIILFGLFLMICGAVGTFFGRLIQASVSRQREFLADASAVQYTRNPMGIGGALRKIGNVPDGAAFSKDAGQCNHMFFSQAVRSLFASHPPITERIARVEGVDIDSLPESELSVSGSGVVSSFSSSSVKESVSEAGSVQKKYLQRAASAIRGIDPVVREKLSNSWSARLVMVSLLIDEEPAGQSSTVTKLLTNPEIAELKTILPLISKIDRASRLPLVDLAAPALQQLSDSQRKEFGGVLDAFAKSDGVISRFEWVVISVLQKHLSIKFGKASNQKANKTLSSLAADAVLVLGSLAYSGADTPSHAAAAFEQGMASIQLRGLSIPALELCTMDGVQRALRRLQSLRFIERRRFLSACEVCAVHDDKVTVAEAETIRAIGDVIDCPVPMFG